MRGPLILAVFAAMGGGGVEPASLGEPFRLSVGQTVTVEDSGIALTFVAVERDSRCPKGVQCIRAGEAIVVLSVEAQGEAAAAEMRFEVPPGGVAKEAIGEHTIRVELEPEARAGKRIERDAYVAIVRVSVTDEPQPA